MLMRFNPLKDNVVGWLSIQHQISTYIQTIIILHGSQSTPVLKIFKYFQSKDKLYFFLSYSW